MMKEARYQSFCLALLALLVCASAVSGAEVSGGNGKVREAAAAKTGNAAPTAAASADDDADDADDQAQESPKSLEQQMEELRQEVQKMRREAEARKKLEMTEEEREKKAEDILSAAGREYTLLKKGALSLEYGLYYSYFSGDVIREAAIVEQRSNHNITNQFYTEYGLRDNFSVNLTVPFVYKYNKVGTDRSQESTDFGDVLLGLQWQPMKSGGDFPATIFSAGVTLPFGSSPYKINPDTSQSTGSGFYSLNAGASFSKTMDPLIAFGNLNYSYSFDATGLSQNWKDGRHLTEVDPGSNIALALGFGYALSYKASLNMSAQLGYAFSNEYHFSNAASYQSGTAVSAMFNIGTGWRITPARSVAVKVGIGLTSNDPDFSISIRVPFEL